MHNLQNSHILFSCLLFIISITQERCRQKDVTQTWVNFDEYRLNFHSNEDALSHLIQNIDGSDTLGILFTSREYLFHQPVHLDNLVGTIRFRGSDSTIFQVHNSFLRLKARSIDLNLTDSVERGDSVIQYSGNADSVTQLRLASNDTVETAWHYTANDLVRVDTFTAHQIYLKDSLNFPYKQENSILTGYVFSRLMLEEVHFVTNIQMPHILSATGMSVHFERCSFTHTGDDYIPVGALLTDCENVDLNNVILNGRLQYGILVNNSRNVSATHLIGYNCLHPISPATWSTNVYLENIECIGCIIDAHPSFYVHYKDITINEGIDYWNCRALGVILENCEFHVRDEVSGSSVYLGMQTLSEKYMFLYDDYDVVCRNIKWEHKDMGYNGLHVHRCRDFLVDSCITHAVSTGSDIRNLMVYNSQIGRLRSYNCAFSVNNTLFDASLQNQVEIASPLSCSHSGTVKITNSVFNGYGSAYLFDYLQSPDTKIRLEQCQIDTVKGFVNKSDFPKESYTQVYVDTTYITSSKATSLFSDIPVILAGLNTQHED